MCYRSHDAAGGTGPGSNSRRSGLTMWKLMEGIVNFREQMLPKYVQRFRKLASSQAPDALFIACSDSRVTPEFGDIDSSRRSLHVAQCGQSDSARGN